MSRNQAEIEPKIADIVHIGGMVFDISTGQLRDAKGCHVPLRSQSAEVLARLARHPDQVIAKDALIAAVWPDRFVTDDSLVQCITDIRRALGAGQNERRKKVQPRSIIAWLARALNHSNASRLVFRPAVWAM